MYIESQYTFILRDRLYNNLYTPKMLGTLQYSPIWDNSGIEAPQSTRMTFYPPMFPGDHKCQSPFPKPFEKHNSVCQYEMIINM